jgi:hypothetical protein
MTDWKPTKTEWYAPASVEVECPRCGAPTTVPMTAHSYINSAGELIAYAAGAGVSVHTCKAAPLFEAVAVLEYDAATDTLQPVALAPVPANAPSAPLKDDPVMKLLGHTLDDRYRDDEGHDLWVHSRCFPTS